MIDFVKKVLLRLYIMFFGVVFYRTEINHEFNHDDSLTIKHINNKEIKFHFYKDEITYYFYICKFLLKRKKIIYSISAEFDDAICESVKQYKELKLHVSGYLFFIINSDKFLYELLLKVYLDCLMIEVKNANKNKKD